VIDLPRVGQAVPPAEANIINMTKADKLRSLHQGPEILVLPNTWDCASARIFEELGYPAIATTSAGVAFSLGYADGQNIPGKEMLAAVARIARSVDVPVTADLEGGYGDIAETASALMESGAVGLNLEDILDHGPESLASIEEQVSRIAAVRKSGPVVINARTDLFLLQIGDEATRFDRAIERLKAYRDAGSDCLFIPGIVTEDLIARFVEALKFPINILAVAGTPSVARLKQLGVARITVGSGMMRSAMGHTRRIAEDLKRTGEFNKMIEGSIPFAEANALFGK
jgi:2-methylisocitrate lyase-like PEP mutase family enzyme